MRRVQVPLLALQAAALLALPFVSHARNRLVSGQPVSFGQAAALSGMMPTACLGAAFLLQLAPLLPSRSGATRWFGLLGAGLTLAASAWLASSVAAALAAAGSPSARTSFGAGAWSAAALAMLAASDLGRGVERRGAAIGILVVAAPLCSLIAADGLAPLSLFREYAAQSGVFHQALVRHVLLVIGALLPALLLGVPLGLAAQRVARVRQVVFPVLNGIQTIPSIALFGLLIGPLSALGTVVPGVSGVGVVPAVLALVLYALLPIVRTVVEGLDGVPAPVRTAARAMGMSPAQAFLRVDAVLALPVLLAGLRVTTVQAVGLAAVSALIGAGGLGAIIFQGLFANALDLVVLGALPVIALAVAADILLRLLADWSRGAVDRPA